MDKTKDSMRSLHARLLSLKPRTSGESTKSRETSFLSSVAQTNIDSGSGSTTETQETSYSELQTNPPAPLVSTEAVCSETMALDRSLTDHTPVEDLVVGQTVHLDVHTALEVHVAMLSFAKRLPLDELHMIGQGLMLSSSSTDNDLTEGVEEPFPQSTTIDSPARSIHVSFFKANSDSSWSFACCSARRVGRDHAKRRCEHDGCVAHEQLSRVSLEIAEGLPTDAKTLSLTSQESNLKSSLALRSTRQIQRSHTQRKHDREANPFGGFAGLVDPDKVTNWLSQQGSADTKAEDHISDALSRSITDRPFGPHTMDETSDIQQPFAYIRDGAFLTGHNFVRPTAYMERAPSFTRRSIDSCDFSLESIGPPAPKGN